MNGLKQVILIKSAKFDFASVNVEGNSLFIGANGAGKTTLLRAILYFYTASSNGLGISSNKKISFSDYYFEYENSYIIYVYKKDDKYVLVTTYKDGNIKFRFTLFNTMPNIKEIFIKDNKPIDTASLWLKLKELGVCSNIIQNGSKYKEILYSKNHKDKMFSLFEAKGYESFTKTLSNIFINSKVDSDAIKKVIVSSLNIDSSIDLSQVHRHLSKFNNLFEDIKSYESNTVHIKKIIELLDEYEKTYGLLADDMATLCNSKNLTKSLLDDINIDIEKLKDEKKQYKEKFEYEQSLYHKRKDRLNQTKGALDSFIKDINSKVEYYEKQNIKDKISLYDSLDLKKSELKSIIDKKDFLTKEFEDLQKNHELQISSIKNSFETSKNSLDTKIFEQKEKQEKEISSLKQNQAKDIELINEKFQKDSFEIKDSQNQTSSNIASLSYEIKTLKKEAFVYKDEQRYTDYFKEKEELEKQIDKAKQEIKLLDKDISNSSAIYDNKMQTLEQNYQKNQDDLNRQIENLKAILYPNKNSLIEKIYKNSNSSQKYIHFLKDEILKSNLEVEFKEDTNSIFEFEPLQQDYQKSDLEQNLQKLKTLTQKKQKEFIKQKQTLQKELKSFETKIYKTKKELNEQIKSSQVKLTTINTKLNTMNEEKINQKQIFEQNKKSKIANLKKEIEVLELELQSQNDIQSTLLKTKDNSIKQTKSYYTKLIKKVIDENTPIINSFLNEIKKQEEQKKKSLKEQENIYHNLLKKNSVDTSKLKELEIKQLKLQESIETLQGYQTIIIEYRKDKFEYIDKLYSKKQKLKAIKKDIEELTLEFDKTSSSLKKKVNRVDQLLSVKNEEKNSHNYQLKRVEEFEKTTTFNDCMNWGVKYAPNEHNEQPSMLIQRIDNSVSRYRSYYTKVQNILGKLNSIFDNSLNITRKLDAIECAYSIKEYHESKRVVNAKSLLTQNLNQIISDIVKEYDKLLQSQGKIESLIKKITKIFDEIQIGVINTLALRYLKTNNKIIETFSAIKQENEQNSLSYTMDSLFASKDNSKTIIDLLKKLIDLIDFEKNLQKIDIEDSFILEFRVVENGNDSKYVPSLDMVGSNGTDVLVKSMIYVAMLYIFKQKITKKELSFQVILDEVGILSQSYLKELIEFANKKGIVFVNGAPDEKLIGTYKQVSLISKIDKISVVKELILK